MKKLFFVFAVLMLVMSFTGLSCSGSKSGPNAETTPSQSQGNQVNIQNFSFSPQELDVSVGTEVTWTNNDSTTHTITFDAFSSGNVPPGQTYKHVFDTVGTFNYHCSIHPSMTGKVVAK